MMKREVTVSKPSGDPEVLTWLWSTLKKGSTPGLERILPSVRKPGRYVGAEVNSVIKDWEAISTRVCLAFPDIYDLGMSNLGLMILYDALNGLPGVLAERAFLPWVDMIAAMREAGMPLYSL